MSKKRQYRRRGATEEVEEEEDEEKTTRDDEVRLEKSYLVLQSLNNYIISDHKQVILIDIYDLCSKTLEELKELQKFRKRPAGVR